MFRPWAIVQPSILEIIEPEGNRITSRCQAARVPVTLDAKAANSVSRRNDETPRSDPSSNLVLELWLKDVRQITDRRDAAYRPMKLGLVC